MRSEKGDDLNKAQHESDIKIVESVDGPDENKVINHPPESVPSSVHSSINDPKLDEYEHLKSPESVGSSENTGDKKLLVNTFVKNFINEEVKKSEKVDDHSKKIEEPKIEEKKHEDEPVKSEKKELVSTFIRNFVTEEVKKGEKVEKIQEEEKIEVKKEEEKKEEQNEPEKTEGTQSRFQKWKNTTKEAIKKNKKMIYAGLAFSTALIALVGLRKRK